MGAYWTFGGGVEDSGVSFWTFEGGFEAVSGGGGSSIDASLSLILESTVLNSLINSQVAAQSAGLIDRALVSSIAINSINSSSSISLDTILNLSTALVEISANQLFSFNSFSSQILADVAIVSNLDLILGYTIAYGSTSEERNISLSLILGSTQILATAQVDTQANQQTSLLSTQATVSGLVEISPSLSVGLESVLTTSQGSVSVSCVGNLQAQSTLESLINIYCYGSVDISLSSTVLISTIIELVPFECFTLVYSNGQVKNRDVRLKLVSVSSVGIKTISDAQVRVTIKKD